VVVLFLRCCLLSCRLFRPMSSSKSSFIVRVFKNDKKFNEKKNKEKKSSSPLFSLHFLHFTFSPKKIVVVEKSSHSSLHPHIFIIVRARIHIHTHRHVRKSTTTTGTTTTTTTTTTTRKGDFDGDDGNEGGRRGQNHPAVGSCGRVDAETHSHSPRVREPRRSAKVRGAGTQRTTREEERRGRGRKEELDDF